MASIALQGICCSYGSTAVLKDVDLSIADGELHTLLGPSGCGKTTALRLTAGFLAPTAGAVLVDGVDVTDLPPEKRHMGVVFQNYALFPQMTVAQNIAYGLKVARWSRSAIRDRVKECLDLVGLGDFGSRNAMDLSGGQQQRVAIARALAPNPSILLLDEPMSNLDVELRQRMREEIRKIQKAVGVTTLFITHDQQEALSLSDRISVMEQGRIVQTAPPRELYRHPASAYVAAFTGEGSYFRDEAGAAIYFARPEQLRLSAEPCAGALGRGTVRSASYQGSSTAYVVARDPGRPLAVRDDARPDFLEPIGYSLGDDAEEALGRDIKVLELNRHAAEPMAAGSDVWVAWA